MWTTDTFSENVVSLLCVKWTSLGEMFGLERAASDRTSIKGLRLPGEWGGRQA